jgi:hypothetical protein
LGKEKRKVDKKLVKPSTWSERRDKEFEDFGT